MRQAGMSMTVIERKTGIARSTLSNWFKDIELTPEQQIQLRQNSVDGWAKARVRAVESHRALKALRLREAQKQAEQSLSEIELTSPILDLAFAMLYLGEGAKKNISSIANSDPKILKFVLDVLELNYDKPRSEVKCELHLRADQSANEMKKYWSCELGIPIKNFTYVAFDQRTAGRPTYEHYKGVCVVKCGSIAIQRKLGYLYTIFCDKVNRLNLGA